MFGIWNLGSLLGKRSPPEMIWTSNEARQCIGMGEEWEECTTNEWMMGEFMFSNWIMIQRGGTNRLPNYTFEHSSGFTCDSMSAESTDEMPSEFSRMLCTIQFAVCIKWTSDLCNSSRIGFPKTVLLEYQPPLPTRRSIQDVKSGGTSLQVYWTLGSLKSLRVPQSTTLGSTSA